MRNDAMWMVLAMAAMCGPAWGRGFCDDVTPTGGFCHQTSVTHVGDTSPTDGRGANAPRMIDPDFATLDMRAYPGDQDIPVGFMLDIGNLNLVPGSSDEAVEVLELGIHALSPGNSSANPTGDDRVLSMAVVRHVDGSWALLFNWLQAAASWSIVDTSASRPAQVLTSQQIALPAAVTRVEVNIEPVGQWASVGASVDAIDPVSGQVLFEKDLAAAFKMPAAALSNQPLRLRTGVLGGDLWRAGMVTQYWFYSPVIASTP
jgi:hypothetical protein